MKIFNKSHQDSIEKIYSLVRNFLKKFFFLLGLSVFILIFLILINNKLITSEILDSLSTKIGNQLTNKNFRVSSLKELIFISKEGMLGVFENDDMPRLNIQMSQNNVLEIHKQLIDNRKIYINALIEDNTSDLKKTYRAKIRTKGDRMLHKESFETMSYRVKLKEDKTFRGINEFSLQKPIIRNYSWEGLIADIFMQEGLLTVKQEPIYLSFNGEKRGIYTYEEFPSKITIERNKRKDGPILQVKESLGMNFPEVIFEALDEERWLGNNLLIAANESINALKKAAIFKNESLNYKFDMDQWAKFYAISDLFGSYHGTVPKSVKYYFNPVTALIEPLIFDSHIGAGIFNNFIILDFLFYNAQGANCEWICDNSLFYKTFLNDPLFLAKYLNYLEKYSSPDFIESIKKLYSKKYRKIDRKYYIRFLPADSTVHRGLLPYMFKFDLVHTREEMIKRKLLYFKTLGLPDSENEITLNESKAKINTNQKYQTILKNDWIHKNEDLIFEKPTLLILRGNSKILGNSSENLLKISGPVTIINEAGSLEIENLIFQDNALVNINNRLISGIINAIDSKFMARNIVFKKNTSEDAINLINTSFKIDNIEFQDIFSDALDLDFSNGEISKISCIGAKNDCLDLSGSILYLDKLIGKNILDKGVSIGENSDATINYISISDSEIGVVVKDGSNLELKYIETNKVELLGAAFIKKEEFELPKIKIHEIYSTNTGPFLIDHGIDSSHIKYQDLLNLSSKEIRNLQYGNEFGAKTLK